MIIKTKIEYEDYRKLLFTLTYKKVSTIVITIVGTFFILFQLLAYFLISTYEIDLAPLLVGCGMVLLFPIAIIVSSKRNFYSNQLLQEEMEYEFTEEQMKIKGESFSSEVQWNKTNRIIEIKDWFLIFQSKISANLIPKKNLSEKEINEIKTIFSKQKGIKLKLKKTL